MAGQVREALLILGNQLFPTQYFTPFLNSPVFMAEDRGLCTHFRYHKNKLVLFLSAMRGHAAELRGAGFTVHYEALGAGREDSTYEQKLELFFRKEKIRRLHFFEIEDKFMERRILECCAKRGVAVQAYQSPMFLTSRRAFAEYDAGQKRPFMKTFYTEQRRSLRVLVDRELKPVGGKWSFDTENRRKLLKAQIPPVPFVASQTKDTKEVVALVEKIFGDHPGTTDEFWIPTTRQTALDWLANFLEFRLSLFGDYEDALTPHSDYVYHSALSPLMNLGLLTPEEVVRATLAHAAKNRVPMNSLEGFIRQVIGWREFVRGIYQRYSEKEDAGNFWKHQRKLRDCWYDATTGIPPLDETIRKVGRLGWTHHIERLMVVSNLMLLCEIAPTEAHRWFMEMYVDSSDWVMGPNVYGMGLMSDGGIFTTKPYICGSNYLLKMGHYETGEWCETVDGLYWSFVEKHREYFKKQPRLSMMTKNLERMAPARKQRIFTLAAAFRKKVSAN